MRGEKRAVSPVIATVLLIAVVVVLALIVFLWARGFIPEAVQKDGMPAEQACDEIDLRIEYIGNNLQVTNIKDIPVYGMDIMKKKGGSVDKQKDSGGVGKGKSVIIDVGSADYDEIQVIPIILGETESAQQPYTCTNKKFTTAPA